MAYAIDPELLPWLDMLSSSGATDHDSLLATRATLGQRIAAMPAYEPANPIDVRDTTVPGPADAPEIPVRIYTPAHHQGAGPGLLYLHGGGFIIGHPQTFDRQVLQFIDQLGVVVVSVDYRLAPEHPFPAAIEDCYAALTWISTKAAELGIDQTRLGVYGASAGGGLAAALTLLARDRSGPDLCFQCLVLPELDDRLNTPSMLAFDDTPMFDRPRALFSWTSYLAAEPGSADISPYAAPARADDLSGLPPAFVSASQFDPLRDEDITYAQRLLQAGVNTDLHHYGGTFHGSAVIETAAVSRRMFTDEVAALRRGLQVDTS
jgi:acetyl esterase/lipase